MLADIVPLAPNRTAFVVFNTSTQVTVTLTGETPSATERRSGPGKAVLSWEKRQTGVADPDIGWLPGGKAVPMKVSFGEGGDRQWVGTINLPSAAQGTGKFRLVIQQTDTFRDYTAVGPDRETAPCPTRRASPTPIASCTPT